MRHALPRGGSLTDRVWQTRHLRLRQLLILHAIGIAAYGTLRGYGILHSSAEGMVPLIAAVASGLPKLGRGTSSMVVSLGLLAASGILVHISGGLIEFHFHFFVMVAVISLYQDWTPFLAAIAFVVLHHGTVGVLDPEAVYNHPAAWAHPWRWAAIHGLFILAMSVASIAAWRLNEFQAHYDPLTRLPNRELFRDRVHRTLISAQRQRRMTAVLLLDLDGFKKVNDSLGHSAGDRLLAEVAERLLTCIRSSDVACRLGGDEFAVLLPEVGGPHDAVRVTERISDVLRAPFVIDGQEILIDASTGIGFVDGASDAVRSAEQLIRDADVAMYRAKEDPDTKYRLFDPVMHAAALNRLENEAALRDALEHQEFLLHYQPIVHLSTGEVDGVEALVRWQHPEDGLLFPDAFIPLAEETGMIVSLGLWVLEEACREVGDWPEGPAGNLVTLSVNLSTRQLRDPDLAVHVAESLTRTGFDPARLILEITEHAMIDDAEHVSRQLQKLRDVGVRISIDDFGTGYSSLSYLARLPVDQLKIDRAFVLALGTGTPEGSLVQFICQLAKAWNLSVVGEGIEKPEELAKLIATGCVLGQGFYFGRPVPGSEARRAVQAASRFEVDTASSRPA